MKIGSALDRSKSSFHPLLFQLYNYVVFFLVGMLHEPETHEQRLHKRLFNSSYYSVDLLPIHNYSDVINISFGFELVKIVEVVSHLIDGGVFKNNLNT